ncbi:helix-turn-helix domain-containing protein [Lysinibacillus fusiformis]|uniref:helix-turn-helix domain-containing protein n=1 Tax=Lysinibacillus fusiformis TaxID=28031 RepID=UPI0023A94AFD|nr:helix-turn-helix transcriptional regulator [Lysinibacillus fusiformis]WEA41802.1 helix-turn-helix transcriptional regulator [Lysinibacillus fusiformis]
MIKCNLAVLLAERNIKISELSKRTGISRTTITALNQNQSKGIQFDTLDTLCNFLKIKPNDLFIQEPLEYDFKVIEIKPNDSLNAAHNHFELSISAEIQHKNELINMTFECTVKSLVEQNEVIQIFLSPTYPNEIQHLFNSIPITFKVSIEQELLEVIKAALVVKINLKENIEVIFNSI